MVGMPRVVPRHLASLVRDPVVQDLDQLAVPREVRLAAREDQDQPRVVREVVDTALEVLDQPRAASPVQEMVDTVDILVIPREASLMVDLDLVVPREVRVDQAMADMDQLDLPRAASPVQEMEDTVDILVIPREVRDHQVMVDTDQEVTQNLPREAEEVDQVLERVARA